MAIYRTPSRIPATDVMLDDLVVVGTVAYLVESITKLEDGATWVAGALADGRGHVAIAGDGEGTVHGEVFDRGRTVEVWRVVGSGERRKGIAQIRA